MQVFRTTFLTFLTALVIASSASVTLPVMAAAQETAPTATSQETLATSDGCNSWLSLSGYTPTCLWQSFMSMLGSSLLTIGGGILVVVGSIFDQLLKFFVVDFQKTLTDLNIMGGIQIAWQLFRDLANVAIIGVFVFVAIMTILGSTEYGTKRLVARVLIVAILINFSFLFTRVIVESSNFVAGQFARSMPNNAMEVGVAQSFLQAFGIHGLWSGTEALTDRVATETDSGWAALLYGLVGGFFLICIAGVLLYGVVMISARALLLIFMLITSALAFATFLIPSWSNQTYIGWNNWWSNLLKAALFGPILMVFLWIAMQIIARASVNGAGTALGKLADDPSKMDVNAWQQLIFLMIGTGILFVGIRAASSFSASITGFNWATVASILPATLGSRFVAAPLGRKYFGMPALERQLALENEIKNAKAAGNWSRAAILQKDYTQAAKIASRDFNAMNTNIAKLATKSLGVPTMLSGEKKLGGAAGIATAAAKEAAKELKNLQPSSKDLEAAGKMAASASREGNREIAQALKENRDASVVRLETERKNPQSQSEQQKQLADTIQKAVTDGTAPGASAQEKQKLQEQKALAENASEMQATAKRIEVAGASANEGIAEEVRRSGSNLNQLHMAEADVVNATNQMALHEFKTDQDAAAAYVEGQKKVGDILQNAIQDNLSQKGHNNPATVLLTQRFMGENSDNKNLARIMDMIKEQEKSQ